MKAKIQPWPVLVSIVSSSTLVFGQNEYRGLNAQRGAVLGHSSSGHGNTRSSGGNSRSSSLSPQQAAAALNQQGIDAYNKGEWREAAGDFNAALRRTPDDPMLLKNFAYAVNQEGLEAWNKGDTYDADQLFEIALRNAQKSDPQNKNHVMSGSSFELALARAYPAQEALRQQEDGLIEQQAVLDQEAAASFTQSLDKMEKAFSDTKVVTKYAGKYLDIYFTPTAEATAEKTRQYNCRGNIEN